MHDLTASLQAGRLLAWKMAWKRNDEEEFKLSM
jgi:hypothetical protein